MENYITTSFKESYIQLSHELLGWQNGVATSQLQGPWFPLGFLLGVAFSSFLPRPKNMSVVGLAPLNCP